MAKREDLLALRSSEVPMIEADLVRQLRELSRRGWGVKRLARELGVARNTVRRYLRGGPEVEPQRRPSRRVLDERERAEALRLFDGAAEGNAVVVARLLRDEGIMASVRSVQRAVAERRRQRRAQEVATVRFETAPGHQMQIDFGHKRVRIAGALVGVHLFVAVLSYSRRLFVRAFLSERHDDWREGIASALRHFGGVPQTLLIDNPKALVVEHDRLAQTVRFHPAFVAFCGDWNLVPRACQPHRARTKGKTENGVKYVKHNAVAGREFDSFAALEAHLAAWMREADGRAHGTTHEAPSLRFERDEQRALKPLPSPSLVVRERRLKRRVASDCLVDVDTVRYSVPHRLVRDTVEVVVGDCDVRIFHGGALVASHPRSREPYARIVDPTHWQGLWRTARVEGAHHPPPPVLASLGRSLSDYAAVLDGAAGGAP